MINLIIPTQEYKNQLELFKRNMLDGSPIHGTGGLEKGCINEWIVNCENYRQGKNLPDGYLPATQFIAVRESDNKIVGLINVRHALNDKLLLHGGHIGYMTAAPERRKGYCKEMLRLCLPYCKKLGIDKVLITCKKWNIGSAKTIIANGGILENEIEVDGDIFQRYWIYTRG